MKPAAVGANDLDVQIADAELFAALGQSAEVVEHQAADGIEIFVAETGAEGAVEIFDLGLCLDAELAAAIQDDIGLGFVEIKLRRRTPEFDTH